MEKNPEFAVLMTAGKAIKVVGWNIINSTMDGYVTVKRGSNLDNSTKQKRNKKQMKNNDLYTAIMEGISKAINDSIDTDPEINALDEKEKHKRRKRAKRKKARRKRKAGWYGYGYPFGFGMYPGIGAGGMHMPPPQPHGFNGGMDGPAGGMSAGDMGGCPM